MSSAECLIWTQHFWSMFTESTVNIPRQCNLSPSKHERVHPFLNYKKKIKK